MPTTSAKYPTGNAAAVAGTWTGTGTTNLNADDNTDVSTTIAAKSVTNTIDSGAITFTSGEIPTGATINSVTVQWESLASVAQGSIAITPYLGATAGTASSNANTTTTRTARSAAVARPGGGSWTQGDLTGGTLKIRVSATSPNTTTSAVYSVDFVRVVVDYTVATPTIAINRAALTIRAFTGTKNVQDTVRVTNSGTGTMNWSASITNGTGGSWLTVSGTSSGSLGAAATAAVVLNADPTGLAAGSYTATFTITATGATNTPQAITVTLVVVTAPTDSLGAAVAALQPIVYLRGNENAGATTLADALGGHNATPNGGVTLGNPGVEGNALTFDGVDDYAILGDAMASWGQYYFETSVFGFWMKGTSTQFGAAFGAVKGPVGSTSMIIGCYLNSAEETNLAGYTEFQCRDSAAIPLRARANFSTANSINLYDGNWHYVAFGLISGNLTWKVWLDGTDVSSSLSYSLTGPPGAWDEFDVPLTIGARNNRGTVERFGAIQIDDFHIIPGYPTRITATDVQAIYNARSTGSTPIAGSESYTVSESAALQATNALAATDTDTLTDIATLQRQSSVVDSWALTEAAVNSIQQTLSATDSVAFGDAAALAQSIAVLASETHTQSEGTSAISQLYTAADTWALAEALVIAAQVNAVEAGTLGEAAARQVTEFLVGIETHTLTDASSLLTALALTANDSFSAAELSALAVALSAADSGSFGDVSQLAAALSRLDSNLLSEAAAVASQLSLSANDAGVFADLSSLLTTSPVAGDDALTQNEVSAVVSASVVAVDAVSAGEAAALAASFARVDSVALGELASALATNFVVGTEAHTVSEVSALFNAIVTVDGLTQNEVAAAILETSAKSASDLFLLDELATNGGLSAAYIHHHSPLGGIVQRAANGILVVTSTGGIVVGRSSGGLVVSTSDSGVHS